MRTRVLLSVLTVGSLLNFSAGAVDQSAPFGFSWGPVDKIPRPSIAAREGNVTLLVYQRDQLFLTELRDTEEIVLEVCKKEGLQQIVWISRLLSAAEEHDKFEAILAEGMRRYGKPETSEQGITYWDAGGTTMTKISDGQGLHRILMVSSGPGFNTCSDEYGSMTGHPLSDYWRRFLPNDGVLRLRKEKL
jgi:hypothetical protein